MPTQEQQPPKKRKFLKYMHYFRAFAIMNIMIVHLWHVPKALGRDSFTFAVDVIRGTLLHDSTFYFIFISGFLFYYLSSRFQLLKYYKGKLVNVISPYVVVSVGVVLLQAALGKGEGLASLPRALLLGTAQMQYWYIPFIALVFVISPLLLRIPKVWMRRLVIAAAVLPLLGTRTGTEVTVWQYLYFFPGYLIGVYFAMDHEVCMAFVRRYVWVFISLAAVLSVVIPWLHFSGTQLAYGPATLLESAYYVQKMSMTFLAVLVLKRLEHRSSWLMDKLAAYSFAAYFLHTVIDLKGIKVMVLAPFAGGPSIILASLVYSLIMSMVTLAVCMALGRLLGSKSRMIIGA